MALPDFSMRSLLEAGAHFGHQAHRWNPKMGQFIFGTRNNIHIIDLAQTVPMLHRALQAVSDTVAKGGRVLFVGTKRQAADAVADAAKRSAQYYVNSRWLGGMLTNWKTISGSISRLRKVDEILAGGGQGLTKKERLMLAREKEKLERALGGIKDMGGTPDLLFVIDTNKEQLAIKEAQRLDRKSTRLNSSHANISYAVFCLKKKQPRPPTTTLSDSSAEYPISLLRTTHPYVPSTTAAKQLCLLRGLTSTRDALCGRIVEAGV